MNPKRTLPVELLQTALGVGLGTGIGTIGGSGFISAYNALPFVPDIQPQDRGYVTGLVGGAAGLTGGILAQELIRRAIARRTGGV